MYNLKHISSLKLQLIAKHFALETAILVYFVVFVHPLAFHPHLTSTIACYSLGGIKQGIKKVNKANAFIHTTCVIACYNAK